MDRQAFVSESLKQIIAGMRSAQEYVAATPTGAKINPRGITALEVDENGNRQPHDIHTKLPIDRVEFDIAVTVGESSGAKAGAGLVVAGIGIGGHKTAAAEHSSVSRIRFSVPVVWPDPTLAAGRRRTDL